LKESLLAEFENDDAITTEDETFVDYHLQHFWSRFGSGQTVLLMDAIAASKSLEQMQTLQKLY
jgi:hypothetical protein